MLLNFISAGLLTVFSAEPIAWTAPATNEMRDISGLLEGYRKKLGFPAVAGAVVHDRQIVGAGAVGERKINSGIPVTLGDKFHIGSCTKSMTALLAVQLAAEGKINLDTKVSEIFPDWHLSEDKDNITLELLLQNRSGLAGKPDSHLWSRAFHDLSGSAPEQRREFLEAVLAAPLEARPGSTYIYSNLGFALAGAMLEQKMNRSWEDLMRERIFGPLRLGSAGFGPPSHKDPIDNPWGHQRRSGEVVALPPSDNPVAIAPAGRVHMSILDLARYAAFTRDLFNGQVSSLAKYRDRMYSAPTGSDYAYGWIVQERKWANGTVLTHSGSNTMFYAVIWIAPAKGYAFVVATNVGDADGGGNAIASDCDQIVAALIEEYVR